MTRSYGSFLLRCWRLDADEQRIEIEHIQSHQRTRVATVAAAVEWICVRSDDSDMGADPNSPARSGDELLRSGAPLPTD